MVTIAHVLTSFDIGGAERVALDLGGAQIARGARVLAVSLEQPAAGALANAFIERGAAVHRIAKGAGLAPRLIVRLRRLFARERVDVVHTHNPLPLVYGAPAARLAGCAAVHTKHGVNPASARARLLRGAAARLLHQFVAVSDDTAEVALAQRDCTRRTLAVIENGIRLDSFAPSAPDRAAVRAELGIDQDAWVVGTVGRAAEPKNQAMLIRAMAPLLDRRTQLVIVGAGPLLRSLEALAGEIGGGHIHVLGARLDVPRILAAFDVFALSSVTEGLPLVVPEAMATSLPIVATAVGGLPDLIDEGETGYLIASEDVGAMRERLAALAGDRTLARDVGARARIRALARHSIERVADEYDAVYQRALGR